MDAGGLARYVEQLPCGHCAYELLRLEPDGRVHCPACGKTCLLECAEGRLVQLMVAQADVPRQRGD